MEAARLVVDEDDAAADHHHHEDRHHDRAGQEVLDVRDVGVDLDHVERHLVRHAPGVGFRLVVGAHQPGEDAGQRVGHEVVGVVLDQRDPRVVLGQRATGEFGRDGEHAVDPAVAQVGKRAAGIVVQHRLEGAGIRGYRSRQLAQPDRRDAAVLVHDADPQVLDVTPEGVAQHHQLNQGEDHRDHDQDRAPAEPAQLALDECPGALHIDLPCFAYRRGGTMTVRSAADGT